MCSVKHDELLMKCRVCSVKHVDEALCVISEAVNEVLCVFSEACQ